MQETISIKKPDFKLINQKIISQSKHYHRFGPVRSYRSALKLFNNNSDLADEFMLSVYGGCTEGELNKIKYDIERTNKKQ